MSVVGTKPGFSRGWSTPLNSYTSTVEEWIARFPVSREPMEERRGVSIVGPRDLAIVEQLRRLAFREHSGTEPTDIFLLGLGEAPFRDMTQIGGLPYRPRGNPWPGLDRDCPKHFLAQFRMTQSKDLFPDAPGDVLLVFVADEGLCDSPEDYAFEWYPLGLTELIQKEDAPEEAIRPFTCYGVSCRTLDYPLDLEEATGLLDPLIHREPAAYQRSSSIESICRLKGVKIGGLPSLPLTLDKEGRRSMRLLFRLPSIYMPYNRKYPFINREEAIPRNLEDFFWICCPSVTVWRCCFL